MAPADDSLFELLEINTDIPKLGVWAGTYCHGDFG